MEGLRKGDDQSSDAMTAYVNQAQAAQVGDGNTQKNNFTLNAARDVVSAGRDLYISSMGPGTGRIWSLSWRRLGLVASAVVVLAGIVITTITFLPAPPSPAPLDTSPASILSPELTSGPSGDSAFAAAGAQVMSPSRGDHSMASYLLGDLALSSLARGIAAEPPESDSLTIGFELSGGSDIPTLITGISVQVIAHQDPRELTALYSCWIGPCSEPTSEQQDGGAGQRGSEQFARTLYADLSSTGETFETKSEGTAKFPFKVTRTDVEYFDLSVTSQNCNCTWKVNVFWTQGTRSGRQQINGSNQPFKTVEDTVVKQYCYDRSNFRGYANVSDAAAVRRLCYP